MVTAQSAPSQEPAVSSAQSFDIPGGPLDAMLTVRAGRTACSVRAVPPRRFCVTMPASPFGMPS